MSPPPKTFQRPPIALRTETEILTWFTMRNFAPAHLSSLISYQALCSQFLSTSVSDPACSLTQSFCTFCSPHWNIPRGSSPDIYLVNSTQALAFSSSPDQSKPVLFLFKVPISPDLSFPFEILRLLVRLACLFDRVSFPHYTVSALKAGTSPITTASTEPNAWHTEDVQ